MIEIPDGNYIHTDIVQFLNQTINSRLFMNKYSDTGSENPEFAELIKVYN